MRRYSKRNLTLRYISANFVSINAPLFDQNSEQFQETVQLSMIRSNKNDQIKFSVKEEDSARMRNASDFEATGEM